MNCLTKPSALLAALTLAQTLALAGCGGSGDEIEVPEPEKQYPDYTQVTALGGDTTTFDASSSGHGYSTPALNLNQTQLAQHLSGDLNFETAFTTAPNEEHPELDGLGPVFNNADCNSCHQRDGRNSTPIVPAGQTRIKLGSEAGI